MSLENPFGQKESPQVRISKMLSPITKGANLIFGEKAVERFESSQGRFLHTLVEGSGDQPPQFIKVAKIDGRNLHLQLKRESVSMQALADLGVSVIKQYQPYVEMADKHAVVAFEQLDIEKGDLLASPELIAAAPVEYGGWAVKSLLETSGVEIPDSVDTNIFKRGDWRSDSPETFWKVWEEEQNGVLKLPPEKQKLLSREQVEDIEEVVGALKVDLAPILESGTKEGKNFFVHNDASPSNAFFDKEKGRAVLLDFEHAGVTNNFVLAQLTDLTNFYGRTWPNPEMQKFFINSLLEGKKGAELEKWYILGKTIIVHGSLFLAKYAMDPGHPEHPMAKMLLNSLSGQLQNLEETYQTLNK